MEKFRLPAAFPEKKCNSATDALTITPAFSTAAIPLNWQWSANPQQGWCMTCPSDNIIRLNCIKSQDSRQNLWNSPNLLLEKITGPEMEFTTHISFYPEYEGDRTGVVVMGEDYALIGLEFRNGCIFLTQSVCVDAEKGSDEKVEFSLPLNGNPCTVFLRVAVSNGAICDFYYSIDGKKFIKAGSSFKAKAGRWTGAKIGYYATAEIKKNDGGYAEAGL